MYFAVLYIPNEDKGFTVTKNILYEKVGGIYGSEKMKSGYINKKL